MFFGNSADDICITQCALHEFTLQKEKAVTKQVGKLFSIYG